MHASGVCVALEGEASLQFRTQGSDRAGRHPVSQIRLSGSVDSLNLCVWGWGGGGLCGCAHGCVCVRVYFEIVLRQLDAPLLKVL